MSKKETIKIPENQVRIIKNYLRFSDKIKAKYDVIVSLSTFLDIGLKEGRIRETNDGYDTHANIEFHLED